MNAATGAQCGRGEARRADGSPPPLVAVVRAREPWDVGQCGGADGAACAVPRACPGESRSGADVGKALPVHIRAHARANGRVCACVGVCARMCAGLTRGRDASPRGSLRTVRHDDQPVRERSQTGADVRARTCVCWGDRGEPSPGADGDPSSAWPRGACLIWRATDRRCTSVQDHAVGQRSLQQQQRGERLRVL